MQALEKRARCWGANVVCLTDFASHAIIHDLIRLGVMCLQEENNTSLEITALVLYGNHIAAIWRSGSGLARLEPRPITRTVKLHDI